MFGYVNLINAVIYLETAAMAHILSMNMPRRTHYPLRVALATVGGITAAFLFPFFEPAHFWVAWLYSILMYLSLLLLALLSVCFCIRTDWTSYLFCAVGGYAFHHLASTVEGLIERILFADNMLIITKSPGIFIYLTVTGLTFSVVAWIFYRFRHLQMLVSRKRVVRLVGLIVLLNIALSSLVMLSRLYNELAVIDSIFDLYNLITSLLAIFILFGMLERGQLEREIEIINQLYKENARQYEISKATMESLHDLKHRVNALMVGKAALSEQERKEISDQIFIFDSAVQTGNETLDIILTEKRMLCHQYGIQLDCMADGSRLAFMDVHDIYSLFGNAFSNAIEAASRQSDDEPKLISLVIRETNGYLSIHLENTFAGSVTFRDGVPMTGKDDPNAHGFGVKSMRRLTERYGGTMTITVQDGLFHLDLLFPNR